MRNAICLIVVGTCLSLTAEAQDPKPNYNPQTGTRRPDTTDYRAYRGQNRAKKRTFRYTDKTTVKPATAGEGHRDTVKYR